MEVEIDHYLVLGLPSGEQGAKFTDIEVGKAYRLKALELHPDKRPNDPNAHAEFQRLKSSYEILKDEKARKLFDELLRVKRDQRQRQSQFDSKRRRMMSDLEERERASFAPDHPTSKAREEEEERISKKLKEEIARIQAMHSKSTTTSEPDFTSRKTTSAASARKGECLDDEKVLKVSWEGDSEAYTAQTLRELFMSFGEVEDVVIQSKKKKKVGSALVVMTSKDAAVAAMNEDVVGLVSNPLLVLPLHKTTTSAANKYEEQPIKPNLNTFTGAGYQAKEDSILKKLLKKAEEKRTPPGHVNK